MGSPASLPFILWLLSALNSASAIFQNITVDDTWSGLVYSPTSAWTALGPGSSSTAGVDASHAHDSTLHVSDPNVSNATVSFAFNGTAVYVFNTLLSQGTTTVQFVLDGVSTLNTLQPTTTGATAVYNECVFSSSGLSPGVHTLSMVPSGSQSRILLDYILYSADGDGGGISPAFVSLPVASAGAAITAPGTASITPSNSVASPVSTQASSPVATPSTSTSSPKSSRHIVAITGTVVGILILLLAGGIVFMIHRRRRRVRGQIIEPYIEASNSDSKTGLQQQETPFLDAISPSVINIQPFILNMPIDAKSLAGTVATETFPSPTEVEGVYRQLEALASEVESIRKTEKSKEAEAHDETSAAQTKQVQEDITNLRTEINRLKQRDASLDPQMTPSDAPIRPLELLRDLALLRAEIEELLHQAHTGMVEIERLPSYSSRSGRTIRSTRSNNDEPPPLPPFPAEYKK